MAAKEHLSADSNIIQDHHSCIISMENITLLNAEEPSLVSKENEFEILCSRVQTATALLSYLKSKATSLPAHDLSQVSLDQTYVTHLLNHVQTVTGVMDSLARRAILAESEAAIQKEKLMLSQQEIQRKVRHIQSMSLKLVDMENFALGTTTILGEMRQRVDDLVLETSRQKQRATDNEQELVRVRTDFDSLKSYVSSLISVRETLVSSEKQFQTIERLFERLVAKTTQLESEKVQKEAEVQKLMEENVRLTALVDKKEAQVLAMNEQCKMMALSSI